MILLLVSIVFIIVRVLPGDPALLHFGKQVNPVSLAHVRHALGLDLPIYVQYFNYVVGLFHGDLGLAFSNEQPVAAQVLSAFPATLELSICSMFVAVLVGVVLGVRSSRKYGSIEDTIIRTFGVVVYSIPVFFLGLIFIAIFAIGLHILPSGGRIATVIPAGGTIFGVHIQTGLYTIDSLLAGNLGQFVDAVKHLILPSLALGLYISAVFHKAWVEVNEEGTEAAAATSVVGYPGEEPQWQKKQPFRMIVDRPFLWAIRDDTTGTLLFLGATAEPGTG
jgi:peptide/nickel transport system permease protein